jgi:integrase
MRKGEIQNLKWSNVNFHKDFIFVDQTKNGDSRIIPLNQPAKKAIISVKKYPNRPFIFYGKDGVPYNFRNAFERAVRKAEIPDFRFHDLRHTAASHLTMSGVDLKTIKEILGHSSLKMVERYSHLSQAHKTRAVEILGNVMTEFGTN